MTSCKEKGNSLEQKVAKTISKSGKWNVKTNITLRDKNGNRSEIDVMYGLIFKKYIECKNYEGQIPLEMVSKFSEVLRQNNIPLRKGIFISNKNNYSPRCKQVGIKIYSLTQFKIKMFLERWIKRAAIAAVITGFAIYELEQNKIQIDQTSKYCNEINKIESIANQGKEYLTKKIPKLEEKTKETFEKEKYYTHKIIDYAHEKYEHITK